MSTGATYDQAIREADKVTLRVICIGRELHATPPKTDPLSPDIRERVGTALRNHIRRCEG